MTVGSVVVQEIDERTTHAVVAAQLRAESRVDAEDPEAVIRSIVDELEGLGLDPDVAELNRRYHIGQTQVPDSLRQRM